MNCKNCGKEIDSDLMFCKYCGINLKEQKKEKKNILKNILNNKKLLIGIISGIALLIIIAVVLTLILTSTKELYKAFNNTLNLKSYKLSVLNEAWFEENEVIYVEKNTEAGTIEYDEDASFHDDGAYHIAGIEVLEDDKFVFDNEEDNYYYYYSGSNVSTSIIEYDGLVNNLLEKLKTYKYKKKNNEYTLKLEKDEELSLILSEIIPYSVEEQAYPNMQITIKDGYINTIKIPYAYYEENEIYYEETDEGIYKYIVITLDDYNKVEIEIPDEIKKSLARNYYNFIIYGDGPFESEDKYYATNNNLTKTYKEKTNICPNGENKLSFNVGNDNGFYEVYFEIKDCSGNREYKELYIKNTSEDFNPLSNHKDDVYNLYDKETNELVGKFTYDGSNTMKIFDSQNYNGSYVKGD